MEGPITAPAKTIPSPQAGRPRAAIYARFSSAMQRDTSIDDQLRQCNDYVRDRLGGVVVAEYVERATSGKSAHTRPEYKRMIVDAESGAFDMLVCLTIDRLGRRLADVADLFDNLSYRDIEVHSPTLGRITQMHVAVYGMMAQEQLKSIADRTRGGLAAKVEAGLSAGGLPYGYEALPGQVVRKALVRGYRRIKEDEAAVVRRIFRDYAAGLSPEEIARRLNQEGIPGPRGGPWRNTTIRGHYTRGTGILNNELYAGRIVWNKCTFRTDPRTGKRKPHVNPPEAWIVQPAEDLRIVDDDVWAQVKARQEQIRKRWESNPSESNRLNGAHRPKYLFSGLLVCSVCGGGYSIIGRDRYGCANRRRGTGMCTNSKTVKRQVIEGRVLAALQERLMAPDTLQAFLREYRQAIDEEQRRARRERRGMERKIGQAEAAVEQLLRLIESGQATDSVIERLKAREAELADLRARLAEAEAADPEPVIEALPNVAEVYAREIPGLIAALDTPELRTEAAEVLRRLIHKVEVVPEAGGPDGVRLVLHGALAEILALCAGAGPKRKLPGSCGDPGSRLSVVAGGRVVFHTPAARGTVRARDRPGTGPPTPVYSRLFNHFEISPIQ